MVGDVFTPKSQADVNIIIAAREAEQDARIQRLEEIATARDVSGLKEYTVTQAETWIDNRIDAITNLAEAKEEIRAMFKKMAPYILN